MAQQRPSKRGWQDRADALASTKGILVRAYGEPDKELDSSWKNLLHKLD